VIVKTLIEQILTDKSAREGAADAQMAVALTAAFAPWSSLEAE
jgi:hypothetical protein